MSQWERHLLFIDAKPGAAYSLRSRPAVCTRLFPRHALERLRKRRLGLISHLFSASGVVVPFRSIARRHFIRTSVTNCAGGWPHASTNCLQKRARDMCTKLSAILSVVQRSAGGINDRSNQRRKFRTAHQ